MTKKISAHQTASDPRNEQLRLFLNGDIVSRKDAKVSIYDSGFMLGDGVWEGLRLYNGIWAFRDEHLDRLLEGALALDLDIGMSKKQLAEALDQTALANGMTTDAHARLMVTRGIKSAPFQHPVFSTSGPTVAIIMEHSRPAIPRPLRLASVAQHRGLPLTQDAKLNSHSKLNCILACIQAAKAGADEALMFDPFGFVNTTNSCNLFIVRKGAVWTSTGDYCMNGITRGNVIALCRKNNIPVFEKNYSLIDTYSADEVFMTGSFGGLTSVGEVDGRIIGGNKRGPITDRLSNLYLEFVEVHCAEHAAPG